MSTQTSVYLALLNTYPEVQASRGSNGLHLTERALRLLKREITCSDGDSPTQQDASAAKTYKLSTICFDTAQQAQGARKKTYSMPLTLPFAG